MIHTVSFCRPWSNVIELILVVADSIEAARAFVARSENVKCVF
jgi:hypothetical protein